MAIFDQAHPKIIETTFKFPKFIPTCKKLVYSICSFLRYSQFYGLETKLAAPILDHVQQRNFQSIFNFREFVSKDKKKAVSPIICSRDRLDLKILQSH